MMNRQRMLRRAVVGLAAIVIACTSHPITGAVTGKVAWRVTDQRVDVINASNGELRYAVIGRAYFHNALVSWCFGWHECGLSLAAGQTASVQYAEISGGALPETEALLVWWIPQGTNYAAFDTAVVRIR